MTAIPHKEIYRYLGYRGSAGLDSERVDGLIREVEAELQQIAAFRMIHCIVEIQRGSEAELFLGPIHTISKNLTVNLKNCEKAILLGATLGSAIDRKLQQYEKLDMTRAVVMQAASAALIEAELDQAEQALLAPLEKEGWYGRPRFSPGYGDLPLELQPDFLKILDMPKRIGVTLTDGLLMLPTKSVTAIIGLSHIKPCGNASRCSTCTAQDTCQYRS